jgi:uncharacterized membrane protein YcaP (DUF421 family)
MENIFTSIILKGIAVFFIALFLTRIMERKLISKMTYFDFVIGVSMGEIIASTILGEQFTSASAITALILLSALTIGIGYLQMKSFKIRKLVSSEPVILIQNGIIVEKNMKRVRVTIEELMMMLRENDVFNISYVEFAIMETDGELSVLLKSDKEPLTPAHIKIQTTSTGLTKDIIIDGNLMEENLKDAGLDREWLYSQLNSLDIKNVSEVFYAGLDNNKKLYISKKNINNKESHGKYGIE